MEHQLRQWLANSQLVNDLADIAAVLSRDAPSSPVELSLALRILRNACAPPQRRQEECRVLDVAARLVDCATALERASPHARLYSAQLAANLVAGNRECAMHAAKSMSGSLSKLWLSPDFSVQTRSTGVSFVYQCLVAAPDTVSPASLVEEVGGPIVELLTTLDTDDKASDDASFWCYATCRLALVQHPTLMEPWLDGMRNSEQLNGLFEIIDAGAECEQTQSAWLWLDAEEHSQLVAYDNLLALSLRTIETHMQSAPTTVKAAASAAASLLSNPPPTLSLPLNHAKSPLLAEAAANALAPNMPRSGGRQTALLRLTATAVHGSKESADAVRCSTGGVAAILGATGAIDPNELTAREWGVVAIRYLTEASDEVCSDINSYQLQEATLSPELRDAGLEVSQDPATGKPILKRAV